MPALILDFDGTMVDSEPLHGKALRAVLGPLDVPFDEKMCVGLPDADVIRGAFAAANRELPPALLAELMARKSAAAAALWESGEGKAYPGAVELLRSAKAAGMPVAVCTAALRREAEPVLARLGVLPLLDVFTTADDVSASKPDPTCYLLTCERLRLAPNDCTAIEDSVAGVSSAVAAGCRVIAVGHTTARERLYAATRFVARIAEIRVDELEPPCH
jgi:HAD superfamily hydrolase (TIGR01509 family)